MLVPRLMMRGRSQWQTRVASTPAPTERSPWARVLAANQSTVLGVVQFTLSGSNLVKVELFQGGSVLGRCTVTSSVAASCAYDTKKLANGSVTITAHGWNSAPGTAFTSDADAGPLVLVVQNQFSSGWSPLTVMATPMTSRRSTQPSRRCLQPGASRVSPRARRSRKMIC